VFVRKLHVRDGHEAELFPYTAEESRRFSELLKKNDRVEDPEIMLMDLADKSARFIDYGWTPAFSRDQAKIVYARQKNSTAGLRVLAATLAGNDILQYDLALRESVPVAQPSTGYLSGPLPGEDDWVAFALSDAVNGAYGGDIGVGSADPQTGKQSVLYKPVKEHGLHHLVRKFAVRDGKCLVLRLRPLTAGHYLADKYVCELVEAASGEMLHSWGEHRLGGDPPADFRICPSGPEIYDNGWQGLPADRRASARLPKPGVSSPDCARVAVIDARTVTIFSPRGEPERRWRASGGKIQEIVWSPDSSRIALVISHGMEFNEKFKFDELLILAVNDMPAAQ
jgi:hypothetical protein